MMRQEERLSALMLVKLTVLLELQPTYHMLPAATTLQRRLAQHTGM